MNSRCGWGKGRSLNGCGLGWMSWFCIMYLFFKVFGIVRIGTLVFAWGPVEE